MICPKKFGGCRDHQCMVYGCRVLAQDARTQRAVAKTELERQDFLNLIGASEHNSIAITIWKTLEMHGFKIIKK